MLLFPNCKINIGLNIVGRRNDGYHNLETIFYPIYKLYDAVEVLPQAKSNLTGTYTNAPIADESLNGNRPSPFTIHNSRSAIDHSPFAPDDSQIIFSGLPVAGDAQQNLCLKAYHLLKKDFPGLPAIDLCLHKAIPMGAGLGGGSADGAFTLLLLNQKFDLQLLPSQLLDYALQLGSDCPFFIINKPCFAGGRGEMLEPVTLNLTGYSIILVHPGIHVSTAEAFAGIRLQQPVNRLQELIAEPVETWRNTVRNDFEKTVFELHPLLSEIKNRMYETGAVFASMSGSGSAIYGVYEATLLPTKKLYPAFFERHLVL